MTDIITSALGGNWAASAYSWGTSAALIVFGLSICGGLFYILFVRKKTRKWNVIIWEPKENDMLVPAETDTVVEKYYNKGKQVAYFLKKIDVEVFPPNQKTTYSRNGKNYCDYIRIQQEYIPVRRQIKYGLDKFDKEEYLYQLKQLAKQKPEEVQSKYIYAPLVTAPRVEFDVDLMENDVKNAMLSAIEARDEVYKDRQSFMEKYGPAIGLSLLAVSIIVVAYLSFDFIIKVQSTMVGPMQNIANALQNTASVCATPVRTAAQVPPV